MTGTCMALISININTVAPIQFAASVNNILACLSDKVCKFLEKKEFDTSRFILMVAIKIMSGGHADEVRRK